jgi:hypothetical protein
VRLENFSSFTFLVRLPVAVAKNGKVLKCAVGRVGWECLMLALSFVFCRQRVSGNDLRLKKVGDFEAQTLF